MRRKILTGDLRAHPAIRAWTAATSLETIPDCIHVYRDSADRALYRLPGVAPGGASVFAKRKPTPLALIEETVYKKILPQLPLTSPPYFGSWPDDGYGWTFVEDVGAERYSKTDPAHLALAGRWVGTLHAEGCQIAAAASLPDGSPARYLTQLRAARGRITSSLRQWPFLPHEAELLTAILASFDTIEARWSRVEGAVDDAPLTVVHGDFRPKNGYVRSNGNGLSLFPIDWETVGWGLPAADLTRINLNAYWAVIRDAWPHVGFDTVERWRTIGRLLELLAAFDWESMTLQHERAAARNCAVIEMGSLFRHLTVVAHAADVMEKSVMIVNSNMDRRVSQLLDAALT